MVDLELADQLVTLNHSAWRVGLCCIGLSAIAFAHAFSLLPCAVASNELSANDLGEGEHVPVLHRPPKGSKFRKRGASPTYRVSS